MENEVNEGLALEDKNSRHHHSHHHHHHHHKSNKKKFSLKRFAKKHKTLLRVATLLLVLVLTVSATIFTVKQLDRAAQNADTPANQPTAPTTSQIPDGQVAVSVTRFDDAVVLRHDIVTTYLNTSISVSAQEIFSEYKNAALRLDQGKPLELSYDVLGLAAGCNVTGFRVEVTEKGQRDPIFRKDCAAGENTVLLYNLKTATTYQYTLRVNFTAMDSITVSGEFETAAGPRLLKVDGAVNVRDFGGWKVGNTYIKQGLLFRGGELDGVVEEEFLLTESGKQTLVNELGIRTEMDLRQTAERSDRDMLGATVDCPDPYNMPFFDGVFDSDKADAVCRVFKDLANPDNYPIYMHCTYGRDRTGTVCLLLGAVLGMDEETLIREYGLSALYYGDADYTNAYAVLNGLQNYQGQTLAERAESYLLQIGVTADEIASLRQIYLG